MQLSTPYKKASSVMCTIKTNTTNNQMKFFNVAASLGALCAVSEAVSIRFVEQNTEETNQGLGHLRTADSNLVQRASPERKELVGQRIERGAQMSLSALAAGASNWWGWYVSAAVDAAQDLALDVVQDVNGWREDALENFDDFVTGVQNDVEGIVRDALSDIGDWDEHFQNGNLADGVAEDITGWVEDVKDNVTKWITQAAEGSIDGVDDVAGDVIGWITDIATDVSDI